jgi:hypothetical protein
MMKNHELKRLFDALAAARRDTPPTSAGGATQWVMVHDMDTNLPHWYPAAIYNDWQVARFPSSKDN